MTRLFDVTLKPVKVTILGLSGSLRAASSNSAVLAAAQELAPPGMKIVICDDLVGLPYFNPDLDGELLPTAVAMFRQRVGAANGILISSPEYAHGVSGFMKNALDWLVGSLEFPGKPVAVVNASTFSTHGHAALIETLKTMSARMTPETIVTLPWVGQRLDRHGLVAEPLAAGPLCAMLSALQSLIRDAGSVEGA